MADISKNNVTFVVCTTSKCKHKNVIFDQDNPPKFCSQCGKPLPPPVIANQAVDESLQGVKKPHNKKVFGNIKPATDHNTPLEQCDGKLLNTRPPSEKSPDDNLPMEESHETRNDKHDDKSSSESSDDGKPPRKKSRDYESPSKGPHSNQPSDGKSFSDKPAGTNLNDKPSTDKSSSDEKPVHKPLSGKPCGDRSSEDKHDDHQLVCYNRFLWIIIHVQYCCCIYSTL